ncbi:MAG TPA: hypothetical protein PLU22_00465 [Polyangiaceae bacterium]|nr:hypothetical protein [Polyangiaceae bacterium]
MSDRASSDVAANAGASPALPPAGEGGVEVSVRAALAWSPAVGLLAAAPALATALGGPARLGAALVVWGATSAVAGALAALTRAALPSRSLRAWGTVTSLAVPPLAGLAALVKLVTHHRPLGAATVAVASLFLVAGCAVVIHRVKTAADQRSAACGRAARISIEVTALVALLGAAAVAAVSSTSGGRATLLQLALLAAAAAALAALPVARRAPGRGVAGALFAFPGLLAVAVSLVTPGALVAAVRAAPWLAPFLGG